MKIDRGQIYVMGVRGAYTGKPRPVVVMQNPNVQLDSVIVVPITSHDADGAPIRIAIEPTAQNGLNHRSFAMCDKITTVPKANLSTCIGVLDIPLLAEIQNTLMHLVDAGEPLD